MATVQAFRALNMENVQVWYGALQSFNSSSITIKAGARSGTYEGNFTYDAWGNVFGQLKGFTESFGGQTTVEVTGIRASAYRVFNYVSEDNAGAAYEYCLRFSDRISGSVQSDKLLGFNGNDIIKGSGGADVLEGMAGEDSLFGGAGSDKFYGGRGADVLNADTDSSRDVFVFESSNDSGTTASTRDRIKNFDRGEDVIDLRAFNVDFTGDAFESAVWVRQSRSGVVINVDVDGDAVSDMSVFVVGAKNLNASDFLL